MEELVRELKQQIIKTLNLEDVSCEDIDNDAPLFGDGLGLDSIDALELIVLLEKQYGIKLGDPFAGEGHLPVHQYYGTICSRTPYEMSRTGDTALMDSPVYITGTGIISAIGNGRAETERALLEGHSGVGTLRLLPSVHDDLPCGEVKLSNEELRSRLQISADRHCNRTALLGIEAIRQALEQSGLPVDEAWLLSGTTVGGMDSTERHFLEMLEGDDWLPLLTTHDAGSTTGLMADYFGIPARRVLTVSTACSSAANALIVGANMIKTGEAEAVIAGGSEALSLFHLNGFHTLMILDTERCRPFDDTRRGLNLGEGAGFVVLESAASVRRRGAKPLPSCPATATVAMLSTRRLLRTVERGPPLRCRRLWIWPGWLRRP